MTTLFETCKQTHADLWRGYVHHPFVQGIQDGTLPPDVFRAYLVQDYKYLLTYTRAFFTGATLAPNPYHMEFCARQGHICLTEELMNNHTSYFNQHGITAEEVENTPTHPKAQNYINALQKTADNGNYPALLFALSSCFVGYVEIGVRIKNDPATNWDNNPYTDWINLYGTQMEQAGAEYLTMLSDCETFMTESDRTAIIKDFATTTQCEAEFWETGYTG